MRRLYAALDSLCTGHADCALPHVELNEACDEALALLAAARRGGEDTAPKPAIYWLADDPETGFNNIEDFADMIDVGEVAQINVAHMLPDQWAAHVRIPATPTSDEDSEIQLFATRVEALAAAHPEVRE